MASEKTRKALVDAARALFAKKGFDETTMNDIAQASGKGRRTVYTYFKNREEIYYAAIEGEIDRMSERLREAVAKNISAEDKLVKIIYTHLSLVRDAVNRNGNLRGEFFRNIWLVEKVRKNFDMTERELLAQCLLEGMRQGEFEDVDVRLAVDIIHFSVKGLEVPYIYGRLGASASQTSMPVVKRILHRTLRAELTDIERQALPD